MSAAGKARVHFIGIGGSGMAPLARLAALADDPGFQISGTDRGLQPDALKELTERGWRVFAEPDPAHVEACDIVVYSTAIAPDHPERQRARELADAGMLVLEHRMDFLMRLVARCPVQLAVAGTHGKTSTASLLGWALLELGCDPDIIVGGRPAYLPAGVRRGAGRIAVYETDESDASFLKTTAGFRLILNVDRDHLEHYGDMDGLIDAFARFASDADVLVLNQDDTILRESIFPHAAANTRFWYQATESRATPAAGDGAYVGCFETQSDSLELVDAAGPVAPGLATDLIRLPLPGRHFASNALGALGLIDQVRRTGEIPALEDKEPRDIVAVLNRFPGVERRLELLGRYKDVAVYDDYGHHPTEIRAVLAALRGRLDRDAQLIAVFQPHRYSRTAALYSEFAEALSKDADQVFLLPIYSAGESPRDGVSAALIRDARAESSDDADRNDFVLLETHDWQQVFLDRKPGDVVVCLGAGDISASIRRFLNASQ